MGRRGSDSKDPCGAQGLDAPSAAGASAGESALGLYDSKRNFGYGRRPDFAARQALRERYGGGHYATRAAHEDRFRAFLVWAKTNHGVRDLAEVTGGQVARYVAHLREAGYAPATIHNAISTINVVMRTVTGGRWQTLSPRDLAGVPRCQVRGRPPASIEREGVQAAVAALQARGLDRAAAVLALARAFGMRAREASLANLGRLAREAGRLGRVNIQEGTKGGRTAPRWVPVTPEGRAAIERALAARPAGSRNLLRPGEQWKAWRDGELRRARETLKAHGIPGFHDARAGYACARYRELTGHEPPVLGGQAPEALDRAARERIAHELGHGRCEITNAYLGGRR